MLSIVIPFFNKWELTHARLAELYYTLPREGVEIVLVDDCSTENVKEGVAFWQSAPNNVPVRYFRHKENGGFGKSMNDGVKASSGDVVVLLSNDVKVQYNFVPDILAHTDDKTLIGNEIIDWPGGWNEHDIDGQHFFLPYLNGWFLACSKTVWNALGGFDPIYGRFDVEDVDLSTRALSLGYNLYSLRSTKLLHMGSQTISSLGVDRLERTKRNRELYENKCGGRGKSCRWTYLQNYQPFAHLPFPLYNRKYPQ